MGVTAVIVAGASLLGTGAQIENASQQRRLAGQAKNRQDAQIKAADNERREAETQESNRAFSKIQRQRQRALAASTVVQSAGTSGGGSLLGSGSAYAGGPAPAAAPSAKTTLGS